ncbi:YopX family protein [Staphylococcus sp. HMSC070D05]|uniref:YopX family protein n=1 Tax=Staphylococcus sp. HMSC070D05 TaxID=1739538 RepID=UPI0008A48919|nr:YopX family protein [Staphylococcus sp. HMSC070D05]
MIPKFRAWDLIDNRMRYDIGVIEFNGIDKNVSAISFNYALDDTGYGEVDNSCSEYYDANCFELMQSTGLKDKNGTEIYVGDIVELKYPYDKRIKTKGSIVWDNHKSCFGISMKETTEQYELYRVTAENYLSVIGNVFENKNLLNEE